MGQGFLIIEALRSHSDTPHLVGLLWTSDQLVAEADTYTTNTREGHPRTSLPLVGLETAIPAIKWAQALDRTATGIDVSSVRLKHLKESVCRIFFPEIYVL
jgi:hypothetical protein